MLLSRDREESESSRPVKSGFWGARKSRFRPSSGVCFCHCSCNVIVKRFLPSPPPPVTDYLADLICPFPPFKSPLPISPISPPFPFCGCSTIKGLLAFLDSYVASCVDVSVVVWGAWQEGLLNFFRITCFPLADAVSCLFFTSVLRRLFWWVVSNFTTHLMLSFSFWWLRFRIFGRLLSNQGI